jgi:LAO/AO transport system kinase
MWTRVLRWSRIPCRLYSTELSASEVASAILGGSRLHLSRTLSWVESTLPSQRTLAREVMHLLPPPTVPSVRIGITGPPGAGKSSLIERVGALYAQHARVAVLCVDPSSALTGGAILGDKTRMSSLSLLDNVFIRPSAAGSALGGLSANTHNQIALLERAGYGVVLVETVGVGQSEHAVRALVDTVVLVLPPASGDSLQV